MILTACAAAFTCVVPFATVLDGHSPEVTAALARSGANAAEIERALTTAPAAERSSMEWLVSHMPNSDLATLDSKFLLEHVHGAFTAWTTAPWHAQVDEAIYFDAILPYASTSEKRELWLPSLRSKCLPLIANATTPASAAVLLNQQIFPTFKVQYSTKRARADQSPSESMASGLASCTGLSILLIDACRSVGVPARFVGVPMWMDGSGNHSWVEIWDGSAWHYTGAAEPAGDKLDEGWFSGRAAGQTRAKAENAIYATTWRDTGVEFPMIFDATRPTTHAIDATDRYSGAAPAIPAGCALVRVDVREGLDSRGPRVERTIRALDESGKELARGVTKGERFDTNDHLELALPLGARAFIAIDPATVRAGEQVSAGSITARADSIASLTLYATATNASASTPLSASECAALIEQLWRDRKLELSAANKAEFETKSLAFEGAVMPFWYAVYGDKPASGRSLYISMHGGGGAPKHVNDQQWENQKKLYKPAEGVYCAPRAPSDTWNLWHQGHIDPLFAKLITDMVLFEDVNPNKVYIMGYSAGGDGVYQLAPRMADWLAAAAMMAGHPNETKPDGLRNLPFTLHMGGEDKAFDRNQIGRNWKVMLDELSTQDVGGYPHEVVIHEGKGHWMDREDAVAVPWMAQYTRNLRPKKVVWLQDDVTSQRFYWLMNPAPHAGDRVVATINGQTITIEEARGVETLFIRLDDSMVDFAQPVRVVMAPDVVLFDGVVERTRATIAKTLHERNDATGVFSAEIKCTIPKAPTAATP